MKSTFSSPDDLKELARAPKNYLINFADIRNIRFAAKNIDSCLITGKMNSKHHLNGINVISSEIRGLTSTVVSWSRTDIKDSSIRRTTFTRCGFDDSAFLNNVIIETDFNKCTFDDTSITGTIFANVRFIHCDLSNLVVKDCNFIKCEFDSCVTSNKLIEHCVVDRIRFYKTNIFVETIQENFGLSSVEFIGGKIRIGSNYLGREHAIAKINEMSVDPRGLSPIEMVKLKFFVEGTLRKMSETLDESLRMDSWLPLCRIPSTFALMLKGFSTFLVNQYEANKIPLLPILKLYYSSNRLATSKVLSSTANLIQSEFLTSIYSASMKLLPYFENYLVIIEDLSKLHFPYVGFNADGPMEEVFFKQFISDVVGERGIVVKKLIKRNSPLDLWLFIQNHADVIALLSVFLSSRLKVEIQRIGNRILVDKGKDMNAVEEKHRLLPSRKNEDTNTETASVGSSPHQILSLDIGLVGPMPPAYQLKLYALFPQGIAASLLLETRISVIYRIRGILLDLLKPRKTLEVSEVRE